MYFFFCSGPRDNKLLFREFSQPFVSFAEFVSPRHALGKSYPPTIGLYGISILSILSILTASMYQNRTEWDLMIGL